VYITKTGKKYHRAGCQYLSKSCIPIDLEDAKDRGYTPCSKCNPPQ
jgi:competence protein ComEC